MNRTRLQVAMSLSRTTTNISETSILSDGPDTEDSSVFNTNAKLSNMDLSLSATLEENSIAEPNGELSITLDSLEREQLKNSKGRQLKTNSLLNLTCVNNTDATKQSVDTICQEPFICENKENSAVLANEESDTLQDEAMDVSDDSIIPVEEDEETQESSSVLDSTLPLAENNMFSHLQPNTQVQLKSLTPTSVIKAKILTDKRKSSLPLENSKVDEQSLLLPEKSKVDEQCILLPEKSKMDEPSFLLPENSKLDEPSNLLPENSMVDPSLLLTDESEYFKSCFLELGRRLWPSSSKSQCYTKGCFWSPDGTCLLVPVHKDGMHIMELPIDLYGAQEIDAERELDPLNSVVHVKESGMVYDATWYPFMNSRDPATCCWLATRKHEPIQMWDAFTGELRCSYRGYDDVDEVEDAISVAFNNDGQKIVGGYKKTIKIFDTNVPGRMYTSIRVKQPVSCMAFTTENDNCVTTGSWNSYIYHYDLRAPKLGPLFTLGGHKGGVTWLKYSSYKTDNWTLFSGSRMDGKILQWDMRKYQKPVKTFQRKVETNQRIYFDLSPMQKWLVSGDTGGALRVWDMDGKEEITELPLHSDCCNGVSFHPYLPLLSTSSGQFHFLDKQVDETNKENANVVNYENCVLLLWFGALKSEK